MSSALSLDTDIDEIVENFSFLDDWDDRYGYLIELGRGLTLTRRRVAGEVRLELGGADKGMIDGLKAMGCFTEIIAFQLRVFLPHGEGVDTAAILARIVGEGSQTAAERAACGSAGGDTV